MLRRPIRPVMLLAVTVIRYLPLGTVVVSQNSCLYREKGRNQQPRNVQATRWHPERVDMLTVAVEK